MAPALTGRAASAVQSSDVAGATIYTEDFEGRTHGETPAEFTLAGSTDQQVVDSESASGTQSYRMSGSHGGCWRAIVRKNLFSDGERPESMRFHGYFKLGDGEVGCHDDQSGSIGWRTVESSSWSAGSGTELIQFRPDGDVTAADDTVGQYNRYEWVEFDVEYYWDQNDGEVTQMCEIDGADPVIVTRDARDDEADLTALALRSDDFTVYWDDLTIEVIDPDDTVEPPDDAPEDDWPKWYPVDGPATGTITDDHPKDPQYTDYHTAPYKFDGTVGDVLEIELTMPDADEWLRVENPDDEVVLNQDTDTAEVELGTSGTYTFYPQAYPETVPGEFTLEITLSDSEVTPDPYYVVEAEALAASPTRAILELEVDTDPAALSDYETGSISSLEFGVSGDGVYIDRMLEIPDDDGALLEAGGNLVLSAASVATGGSAGAVLGTVGVALNAVDVAQEFQQLDTPAKAVDFTGDDPLFGMPVRDRFDGNVRYMVEVESTEGPIDSIDDFISGWGDVFNIGYLAQPPHPPGGTEPDEQYYTASVSGDIFESEAWDCP